MPSTLAFLVLTSSHDLCVAMVKLLNVGCMNVMGTFE